MSSPTSSPLSDAAPQVPADVSRAVLERAGFVVTLADLGQGRVRAIASRPGARFSEAEAVANTAEALDLLCWMLGVSNREPATSDCPDCPDCPVGCDLCTSTDAAAAAEVQHLLADMAAESAFAAFAAIEADTDDELAAALSDGFAAITLARPLSEDDLYVPGPWSTLDVARVA